MTAKEKKSKMPLIIAFIVVLIFVVAALIGLNKIRARQSLATTMPINALAVKTLIAPRGVLSQKIPALATVKSAATILVKGEIAGRIIKMPLREGDHFKKGDLLAIIDGREQQAQLSAAKARSGVVDGQIAAIKANINALESQRQGLKSNFEFLETELRRYEKLFDSQAISASAIDAHRNKRNDAESKLLSLLAQIQAQKAQIATLESQKQASRKEVELWQVRKDYSEIFAEVDGVVSMRHQEEGNRIMPGTPILTVDDISYFRLIMQLPQGVAGKIKIGQAVYSPECPDARFEITRIYPGLNEFRQFVVEAGSKSSLCRLKFDMQLAVDIVVNQLEGTLVKRSACFINFRNPRKIWLYPVYNGVARRLALEPLLVDAEGNAIFDSRNLPPDSLLAEGAYLENVRLPASFPVEVLK